MSDAVPAEAQGFADAIGVEATIRLMLAAGGTRVFIPKRPTADSPLARIVGLEPAVRLGAAMGGERPYIPICRAFVIRYLRARGETISAIARRLKCSEPTVYAALRAERNRQLDLFAPADEGRG